MKINEDEILFLIATVFHVNFKMFHSIITEGRRLHVPDIFEIIKSGYFRIYFY